MKIENVSVWNGKLLKNLCKPEQYWCFYYMNISSCVHATLWSALSVCRSVCLLVRLSVGPWRFLFFSPFYVVRSLFKSFYILAFSLLVLTTARDLEVLALFLFLFIFFLSSCLQNLLAAYKHCLRAWALCRSLNKDRDEIIQISIWAGSVIKKPLVNIRTNSVMDGRMDGRSNGLTELVVQTPDRH